MIKAIMLIFEPGLTWDKIAQAQRGFKFVMMFYLVPLILLSVAGELAGDFFLGQHHEMGSTVKLPAMRLTIYGAAQLVTSFLVVLIGASVVKSMAVTFQNRNNYSQCFRLVAYALSPLFLVRLADAFPFMNPWATFGIGMVLCVGTLYYGIPKVLLPDPPHAFGLYVVSSLLLTGVAGLARFLTWLIIAGRIKGI